MPLEVISSNPQKVSVGTKEYEHSVGFYVNKTNIVFNVNAREYVKDNIEKYDVYIILAFDKNDKEIWLAFDYGYTKKSQGTQLTLTKQKQLIASFRIAYKEFLREGAYYTIDFEEQQSLDGLEYFLIKQIV